LILRKNAQKLFTPKLATISKKEGYGVPLFFWDESGKKYFDPRKPTFFRKPKK